MDRPLLILDLDETLVSAVEHERTEYDFRIGPYYVVLRPHLSPFLGCVFRWYAVAVWTSSGEQYAAELVSAIFPDPASLQFCWTARRCTRRYDVDSREHYAVKDLKKVRRMGHNLGRVVMLDDSPEKLERNYGNHLRVEPFEGDANDRELLEVLPFLEWLKEQPDFRTVDKRSWRTRSTSIDFTE